MSWELTECSGDTFDGDRRGADVERVVSAHPPRRRHIGRWPGAAPYTERVVRAPRAR
ncbi:hypothetical protein ACFPM0_33855 [Pseudonocardia sulfidoxydans]|uniref:hypothetical protein n=1 Tax=Pseudonocardia sulfidoxydans TaxID=54011 RepID=UPI003619DE9E